MSLPLTALSDHLKLHTKVHHQQVEKLLVARMRSIDNPDAYVELLQLFYGYFSALEDKINQHIGPTQLPDYAERRKSESLFNDIESVGNITPQKPEHPNLPMIENRLQAFGALYVIEGSTLGGKIISKLMAKQLDLQNNKGLSFFIGYGDKTEKMWEGFKEILNLQPQNRADAIIILDAANDTFNKFKFWIENANEQAIK